MLLDTNVLVHAVDTGSPHYASCSELVRRAMAGEVDAVLVPQVLLEFFAVVTAAGRVRTRLAPADALEQIADWQMALAVLQPTDRCLDEFERLAAHVDRSGRGVYDLFLAAQMRAHGIAEICTANTADFAGIPGVTARTPESV